MSLKDFKREEKQFFMDSKKVLQVCLPNPMKTLKKKELSGSLRVLLRVWLG